MIWGKTNEEVKKMRPKIGNIKVIFIYLPTTLLDGRWVWWEYVLVEWKYTRPFTAEWVIQKVVKKPAKFPSYHP